MNVLFLTQTLIYVVMFLFFFTKPKKTKLKISVVWYCDGKHYTNSSFSYFTSYSYLALNNQLLFSNSNSDK